MMWKKTWKIWAVCMMLLLCISGVTVFASGSDDNSLSDLGIENATSISPDFEYSTTEYEVEVPEGTTELQLSPVTSDGAATCEVSGQTLTDGKTTVYITVTSESGMQATYTLNVQAERPNAAEQIAAANETDAQTEAATEKDKIKSDADFSIKVIYALVALSVLLIFLVINLILKNRDLKDDLRDTQERLDMQTNEFARKEYYLATENYYAPTQQQEATGMVQEEEPQPVHPETEAAPAVEEAFGENKKTGPVKADRKSRREKKRQQKQAKQEMAEMQDDPSGAQPQEAQVKHTPQPTGNAAQPAPKKTKKKADINMIDL